MCCCGWWKGTGGEGRRVDICMYSWEVGRVFVMFEWCSCSYVFLCVCYDIEVWGWSQEEVDESTMEWKDENVSTQSTTRLEYKNEKAKICKKLKPI